MEVKPNIKNDNRDYRYQHAGFSARPEYSVIADWVPTGASVLDLGCGNGSLMQFLQETRQALTSGVDRSVSGVENCRTHLLSARVGEIDQTETYAEYHDLLFDVAICNVSLQMVMYPEVLLLQMARVAKKIIVSFPHFGHLFNRLDLLVTGKMPRAQLFGYPWYATGHIHQLGIEDFRVFCREHSLSIRNERHMGRPRILSRFYPNLFSRTALFLCEKTS